MGEGAAVGRSAAARVAPWRAEAYLSRCGKGGEHARALPVAWGARGSGGAHMGSRGCGRQCRAMQGRDAGQRKGVVELCRGTAVPRGTAPECVTAWARRVRECVSM